ncbi:MAG: acetyltransferase [Actinomycetia bacterium]|nr:acetyltransferase [Actinomycetes bacterium]
MSGLLVLGAGGHGRVVAYTARCTGLWSTIAYLDDRFPGVQVIDDCPLLGRLDAASTLVSRFADAVVALGDGRARMNLMRQVRGQGFRLPVVIHPSAAVSEHAEIGAGTVVFAQCVVHPGATLGEGCIVNTAVTIDHDCHIGAGVHLSPGVHIGGEVRVGDLSWLGVGASVKNGITIGARVMVGAGAAVVTNIPDSVTVVGVPAHPTDTRVNSAND